MTSPNRKTNQECESLTLADAALWPLPYGAGNCMSVQQLNSEKTLNASAMWGGGKSGLANSTSSISNNTTAV
jgi:hypothetical protein